MKEKRIRRILVVAILVIAAASIIIKFNIKAPEKANAPSEIVAEANNDTEESGNDTEDEPSDDSKDEPSGDSTDDSDENNDNGGDNDSNTDNNPGNNDNDDIEEPSGNDDTDGEDPVNYITVYITIDATLLADGDVLRANNRENKIEYTGDNGIIASRAAVKVPENASVYDALHTFCLENDIQMEASGTSFSTAYIRGINHLYEFDGGISSGWVFLVNRVYATSGASNVHLKEGDEVWWFYTLAFGKDVPGK